MRKTVALLCAALVGASSLAVLRAPAADTSGSATAARPVLTRFDWRSVLNFYRATAGLEPVREEPAWSRGARLHSRYMVRTGDITHEEDPSEPAYTAAGDAAGSNGNVALSTSPERDWTERGEVEGWMAAPFHALGMVDPALRRSGFGWWLEERRGMWSLGSTLDVLRGRSGDGASRPHAWPADGMQVPLRTYSGNEWPDPLTSCSGYRGEVGLPILAMFPRDARIRSTSFASGGQRLAHCAFDARSYRNPRAADQERARAVLDFHDAVVLIPKLPLEDLRAYTATVRTTAGSITWTFTVGEVEPPEDPQITGAVVSRTFQEQPNFGLAWTARDEESGVASYDVRWRSGRVDRPLGAWRTLVEGATGSSMPIAGEPGTTYCFAVRATDRAGNRSGWSPTRCTSVPLRSIDLEAEPLWVPLAGDHYAGTASMALLPGSTLRTGVVHARRIALVVTREPGAGRVEVLWNGARLAVLDLDSPTVRHRFFIELPAFARLRSGRITIRALDALERVVIEGVGVARA